jgi:hypothetical protein
VIAMLAQSTNSRVPVALPHRPLRHGRLLAAGEALLSLAALAGAVQLAAGVATPPVSALEPLGLDSWMLPGLWLFASVAVPSGVAAVLAFRGSRHAPTAALVASACLAVELAVQIPFVGPSMLQAVLGTAAALLAALALRMRRSVT